MAGPGSAVFCRSETLFGLSCCRAACMTVYRICLSKDSSQTMKQYVHVNFEAALWADHVASISRQQQLVLMMCL